MTTTTYRGQTAAALLRTAHVAEMRAGNYEIVVTTKDGAQYVAMAGGRRNGWGEIEYPGVLVLEEAAGVVARLSLSARGKERLANLGAAIERAHRTTAEG